MTYIYLAALANLIVSVAIMTVCVCRLNQINKKVRLRIGYQYVILLVAAGVKAIAPLAEWGFPGWPSVIFALAVLFMLLADSFQWHHGPPDSVTVPGDLPEH
jgi:hypothetical protein